MSLLQSHPQAPRLLDQVRQVAQLKHFSYRTEESYIYYIRQFILFHHKRHPKEMGIDEIRAYLSHLATDKHVAASTQNVARCAIIFLYQQVLKVHLPDIDDVERAKRPIRVPVVFSRQEVQAVLSHLSGIHHLMASLLYGSGLRVMECVRLRIKDVDFDYRQITVRDGKGKKDRVTMLPQPVIEPLQFQLKRVKQLHQQDMAAGYGSVYLPNALAQKYPNASCDLKWQYFFPADRYSTDPRSQKTRRHHIGEQSLQRAVKQAVHKAGILKHGSCHTFRHSFATHLLAAGYDIRTVQELVGHKDVRTTMIYTHVLKQGGQGVKSPLEL
ncbi:MAG: integron integrase [Thermosynechococcaceae cyanobacterium]